jgi:hypothetical protein
MRDHRSPAVVMRSRSAQRGAMTALASSATRPFSHTPASPETPSLPRLVAGALLATIGIVIFSVAVGGYVVGTHAVSSQADEARKLVGATPILVAIGVLHLLAAVALVRGGDVVRHAAVLASGLASLAAAGSAAMFAAGVDPISWSDGPHASPSGLAILAVLTLLYGTAAVAAGSGPVED